MKPALPIYATALAALLFGGCAAPATPTETSTKTPAPAMVSKADSHAHSVTVKPGADVSLNVVKPDAMRSGTFVPLKLQFGGSDAGQAMNVRVKPRTGLSLSGAETKLFGPLRQTQEFASDDRSFDIDVKAAEDGIYFLDVFTEAGGLNRSFSVRLDIGKITPEMIDAAMPQNGTLIEGGKIRALEAQETIQ